MPTRPPSFRPSYTPPAGDDYARTRADRQPWQRNYKLQRWRNIRHVQLMHFPLCAECLRATPQRVTAANVVHHIEQHHGDDDAFWNGPLESVCKPCHDREIQSRERITTLKRTGASASKPEWLTKATIPFTVVCGPPGAGKSHYVRTHARAGDRIICFDTIASELFPTRKGARPLLGGSMLHDVLRRRNEQISECTTAYARSHWQAAWLTMTAPRAQDRTWWHTTLGARVLLLPTPSSVCRARIELDAIAGDVRRPEATAYVDVWWSLHTKAACDVIVDAGEWR